SLPTTPQGARLNEFRELQRAATHGHPSQPSQTPGAPPLFEVIPGNVIRALPGPGGHSLRITPVSRLRVVMVQIGYRRMGGDLVSSIYVDGQNRWLPGVELHGEGIFIDLTPPDQHAEAATDHLSLSDADSAAWRTEWQSSQDPQTHPVFVWWHMLAH